MIIFNYISKSACITLFTAYKYYPVIPTSLQFPDAKDESEVRGLINRYHIHPSSPLAYFLEYTFVFFCIYIEFVHLHTLALEAFLSILARTLSHPIEPSHVKYIDENVNTSKQHNRHIPPKM